MKEMTRLTGLLIAATLCSSCGSAFTPKAFTPKKVHDATGTLPNLPKIDVSEPDRFLNDLMLSPLWKVGKEQDGPFIAKARSVGPVWPSDGEDSFLFEFMAGANKDLPRDYRIYNGYLDGDKTFSSFRVTVVFQPPDLTRVTVGESGRKVTLGVYEAYEGPEYSSDLAIKISTQHDIYVVLHEEGADPGRKTTFAKALPTMRELAGIADSPKTYRVEERHAPFFKLFFSPSLEDEEIKRFPGIQDCDTFYGYLRAKPDTNYAGVNIKISHPVYCPDEGTRKSSRLQKAEYLGTPSQDGDILFFLIEDNTVYLSGEYDQQFGTFTGGESFEGTLEILNEQETVLLRTTGQFKGWQR